MTREQQAVEGLRSPTTGSADCSVANRSAVVGCVAPADFAEGLKAFVERGRPVFVGA
jgi:hypothetical protein